MPFAAMLSEVDQLRDCQHAVVDAQLAKKGRSYEHNQYFLRFAYRALHDLAAPLDEQAETTHHRVSVTKDVPILRIDHISTQSSLLGVWQAIDGGGVLDFKEMTLPP